MRDSEKGNGLRKGWAQLASPSLVVLLPGVYNISHEGRLWGEMLVVPMGKLMLSLVSFH